MASRDTLNWMLSNSIEALARAERLHRQFFQLDRPSTEARPGWEPPIDVIETPREVLVLVALPGVDPEQVESVIEDRVLRISGHRVLPRELQTAVIHRLELPQGRFERRIALPPGRYTIHRTAENGCIVFSLVKA